MEKITTINKDFFFVISKKANETIFFFDTKSKSISFPKIVEKKEKEKTIRTVESKKDGYYIINNPNKLTVLRKGNIPYYIFLKNHKGKNTSKINITINFIDGTEKEVSFMQLKDDVYYYDASAIDRVGWIENQRIFGIRIPPFDCINESLNISQVSSSSIQKMKSSSSIDSPKIATDIAKYQINTSLSN